MKVEILQTGFRIIPESPQDNAYFAHVLGCEKVGDIAFCQVNGLKPEKPGDPVAMLVIRKMTPAKPDIEKNLQNPQNIEQALAAAQAQGLAQ